MPSDSPTGSLRFEAVTTEPPDYLVVLRPNRAWFRIDWAELWEYRDLLLLLVRRDLLSKYRQTILGPLWYIIQPVVMAVIFSLVFARTANLSTQEVPPLLYYLCGLLPWTYFAQCLTAIASTFTTNAGLFAKVYFPRLLVPAGATTAAFVSLALQFVTFLIFAAFYRWGTPFAGMVAGWTLLLLPLLVLQTALFVLGAGLWIAALTARFRDLLHALPFIIMGWMFLTPIFLPLSEFAGRLQFIAYVNPMAPIVESFRHLLLGTSQVDPSLTAVSVAETVVLFVTGVLLFQRVERTAIDHV
jgi:lipopolysaccharide transport system permease protein